MPLIMLDAVASLSRFPKSNLLNNGVLLSGKWPIIHPTLTSALPRDLASEFEFRGIERPFDLVREEFEKLKSFVDQMIKQKQEDDPGDYERMGEELARDIHAHKAQRNKSS